MSIPDSPYLQPGDFLSPAQVAECLPGVTENALAIRRHRHQEPTFCRLGRAVLYPRSAILDWINAETIEGRAHVR